MEEAGYIVRPRKILAVLDKAKHPHPPGLFHTYKIFIGCELLGGQPLTGEETDGVGFFSQDELPPLSEERVTKGQIWLTRIVEKDTALANKPVTIVYGTAGTNARYDAYRTIARPRPQVFGLHDRLRLR